MAKATIQFYPNEDKVSKRTNRIPIYCRIQLHGKKAEKITNLSICMESLARWNPMQMRLDERGGLINNSLTKYEDEFNKIVYNNSTNLYSTTAVQLRDVLFGEKCSNDNTILVYFKKFVQTRIDSDSNLAVGTKKNYRVAIHHLEKFLNKEYSVTAKFADLDSAFGNRFYDYLISEDISSHDSKLHKLSIKHPTIAGIIKKLKRVFKRAVIDSLINKNPFTDIKLDTESPLKEKLSESQVNKIANYNFSNYPSIEIGRDIFLFLLYTGLGYSDAMNLTNKSLDSTSEQEVFFDIMRQKTKQNARNFLVRQALDLVEKFKGTIKYNPNNYILPRLSLTQFNLKLKTIAELTGIPFNFSSHIGRHTYRQFLHEAEVEDMGTAKMMMGHSRKGDIESKYYNVSDKKLISAKNKFQVYLDSILNKNKECRQILNNSMI